MNRIPLHGGESYAGEQIRLDFSVNVNPLGLPPASRSAWIRSVEDAERYPDRTCRKLRERLAEVLTEETAGSCMEEDRHTEGARKAEAVGSRGHTPKADELPPGPKRGILPSDILCGNGASDLFRILVQAVGPVDACVTAPCFSGYERALRMAGVTPRRYRLLPEKDFAPDEGLLRAAESLAGGGRSLLFLCQPNNPTGNVPDAALLRELAALCGERGIYLVMDECFLEFLADYQSKSCLRMIRENPCILIVRAFTKICAMPSLRLGYLVTGNRELMARMRLLESEWSVSGPAQMAGAAALSDRTYFEETRRLVGTEHAYLYEKLSELGFRVFSGQGNFLLFSVPDDRLRDTLAARGILIRDCGNFEGLADADTHYYRIAVKRHSENETLVRALSEIRLRRCVQG